jgi:hypothetical protein
MDRKWRLMTAAVSTLLVVACATSHIMIGTPRPPISADLVKVYFHPPETKFDEIAMIDTSSKGGFGFTAQGKTDVVLKRLKEEAAKLGANGILLQGVGTQSTGSIGTGYSQATASGNSAYGTGIGISGSIDQKVGSAVAIYVPQN